MTNKTIKEYQDNTSIDGANDYFLGEQNSTGDYRRYTRNSIMGVTGQPVDINSVQTLSNKTLTAPVVASGMNVTGTLAVTGNETVSGTMSIGSTLAVTGVLTPTGGLSANSVANTALATGISSAKLYNPYKFSVYLNSAQNSTTTPSRVLFDAAHFDTSSNVDLSTNKGRFTAPVAGFYQFNFHLELGAPYTYFITSFYVNGSSYKGAFDARAAANQGGFSGGGLLQLSANDYVEVYTESNATIALNIGTVKSSRNYFTGYLVSAT